MLNYIKIIKIGLVISFVLLFSGCATTGPSESNDPYEGYNRAMYSFNKTFDKVLLKPVAQGYDAVVPDPISHGISNFFSNINDLPVIIHDLLQGKFEQAYRDTYRFVLNTTVGVAGIFDVASLNGFEKNDEDFGQTMGSWGADTGPYIVLPFLGPSNVRDGLGLIVDFNMSPITQFVDGKDARTAFWAANIVDRRASLLKAEKVLDEAALDEYAYVRDAYLQRRENLVYDGNPPEDDFDVFED